jgi:hypothetical protein
VAAIGLMRRSSLSYVCRSIERQRSDDRETVYGHLHEIAGILY